MRVEPLSRAADLQQAFGGHNVPGAGADVECGFAVLSGGGWQKNGSVGGSAVGSRRQREQRGTLTMGGERIPTPLPRVDTILKQTWDTIMECSQEDNPEVR